MGKITLSNEEFQTMVDAATTRFQNGGKDIELWQLYPFWTNKSKPDFKGVEVMD